MLRLFGDRDGVLGVPAGRHEDLLPGEAKHQGAPGRHRRKRREAEALAGQIAAQQRHVSLAELDGRAIVGLVMVRLGRHVGGHDLERHVPEVGGDGQRRPPKSTARR